jgi:hypothetical protein
MPKIQLLRRDSSVIELEATTIAFGFNRSVSIMPLPVVAVRAGIDMNQTSASIRIDGILTDDEEADGGSGASMTLDLSMALNATSPIVTFRNMFTNWSWVLTNSYGAQFTFQSAGQVDANLGENITVRLVSGSVANTVATQSIINVNIASTTNTTGISDAINTALGSANVKVNTSTTAFSSIFAVSRSAGQQQTLSSAHQGVSVTNEKIQITNTLIGESGNVSVSKSRDRIGASVAWTTQFMISNFTNGVASSKMTKGDKMQDLMNIIMNSSAGGAMISPQVLAGGLVDLPDSISSIDTSKFLNISEAKVVKKYIVGVRIPYESLASSTSGQKILRQFVLPAGPGTDYSAASNTTEYDPVDTVNGVAARPNPFFKQGVAIPAIMTSFEPSYEAGDSVWSYSLTLIPVEQLVGI